MNIFTDLRRREEKLGRPLTVAVLGAGFLGGGLVHHLSRIKGMCPALVANRTSEKAISVLRRAGVERSRISLCEDPGAAARASDEGFSVVVPDRSLAAFVPSIDVIMEATGTMRAGTEVALQAMERKKHIVEANPEVQVFYRPYVIRQFEAPLTAAEAVLYGTATATPLGAPVADVGTFAKRDVRAGEPLEGIGGSKHHGFATDRKVLRDEDALPVGLAEYATLTRDVLKDGIVRYRDVDLDEAATVVRLRRQMDAELAAEGRAT